MVKPQIVPLSQTPTRSKMSDDAKFILGFG